MSLFLKKKAHSVNYDEFLRGPESPLSQEDKDELERDFVKRVGSFHWENEFIASLGGGVLAGLGEAGIKGLTGLILKSSANKVETALLSGMLREAVRGKGNFGIGNATVNQADTLGYAWAGEGAQWSSSGKALVSADGLRQYRPANFKPGNVGKTFGKVQANLEWRLKNSGEWQGNAHIDITP